MRTTAKLAAAVPRAHGPDLFIDAHERLGIYSASSVVAPMGDALPDEDVAAFDATAVAPSRSTARAAAVPLATKCLALYVNDDSAAGDAAVDPGARGAARPAPARASTRSPTRPRTPTTTPPSSHGFGGRLLEHDGALRVRRARGREQSLAFVRGLMRAARRPAEPSGALVKQLFASGRGRDGHRRALARRGLCGADAALPRRAAARHRPQEAWRMRPPLTVEAVLLSPVRRGAARGAGARALARRTRRPPSSARRVGAPGRGQRRPRGTIRASPRRPAPRRVPRAAARAEPMPTSTRMRAAWVPAQEAMRRSCAATSPPKPPCPRASAASRTRCARRRRRRRPRRSSSSSGCSRSPGALSSPCGARVDPAFRAELRASRTAYRYVAHAAVVVFVLVVAAARGGGAHLALRGHARRSPRYVGLGNYVAILTARGGPLLGHGSFYLTLRVTVLWTVCNVTLHLAIGVALGVLLSGPR